MDSPFIYALAVVGGATLLYVAYTIVDFVTLHFFTPSKPLDRYKRKGGPAYALITGGSAGIGRGVAQELLNQGFGVVLLGHLASELDDTKQSLEQAAPAGATVRTVVMDALTATPSEMEAMVKSLEGLQISILMNNIGGCPVKLPPLREMTTYSCSDVDVVIDQNARFMARLTALMLPILSRKPASPGQRSLVLNMSSAGMVGVPYLTMYGATKSFNLAFSRGVARELETSTATSHIDCLAIIPGEVLSQGNSKGVPAGAPTSDAYGRCLVRTVDGAVKRKMRDLSPYWVHDIENRILPWLDEGTRTRELTKAIKRKKDAWDMHFAKSR